MHSKGNTLRTTGLNGRVFHVVCRWVASIFIAACIAAAPCVIAQGNEDVPTIRVETQEVLIPTLVTVYVVDQGSAIRSQGYYDVQHLGVGDFHLFEDGKEQTINSVALARPYSTGLQRDNLGYQFGDALS